MTTDLKQATVCVVDSGLFLEFALRLARSGFKRVLYWCDVNSTMPRVQEASIGDGFDEIGRVRDFWDEIQDIDMFAFPDCSHPELQKELIRQGFPVFGSRAGVFYEWHRIHFKKLLKEVGLPVRPYHVANGVTELRAYLRDRRDQYVKISHFRGNDETWHWHSWDTCEGKLDQLTVEFGPLKDEIRFLVEDGFPATEIGYDGYFAGGKFPELSFHGMEQKDKSYFGAVVSRSSLPSALQTVNEAMAPLLSRVGYANFFSTEVRIDDEGTPYFTDPTCREASPAGECLLEGLSNLPEIVWAAAHGEMIDPVPEAKFAAQAVMEHTGESKNWRSLVIPAEVRRWVKLFYATRISGDLYAFPNMGTDILTIGSVIGLGDTPTAALDALKEHVEALKDQPVTVKVESLAGAIKELEDAEGETMETGDQPLPEPQEALT